VLWYFLVALLAILAVGLIIAFFAVFGAGWEFIKCFKDDKRKRRRGNDWDDQSESDSCPPSRGSSNVSNEDVPKKKYTKSQETWIIVGLVILGLFAQPFYLLFKMLEVLMECYRRYGCWFYYFGNY
jgi:hypothetical protein